MCAVNNPLIQRADASVLAEGELIDLNKLHKDKKRCSNLMLKILVRGETVPNWEEKPGFDFCSCMSGMITLYSPQ